MGDVRPNNHGLPSASFLFNRQRPVMQITMINDQTMSEAGSGTVAGCWTLKRIRNESNGSFSPHAQRHSASIVAKCDDSHSQLAYVEGGRKKNGGRRPPGTMATALSPPLRQEVPPATSLITVGAGFNKKRGDCRLAGYTPAESAVASLETTRPRCRCG